MSDSGRAIGDSAPPMTVEEALVYCRKWFVDSRGGAPSHRAVSLVLERHDALEARLAELAPLEDLRSDLMEGHPGAVGYGKALGRAEERESCAALAESKSEALEKEGDGESVLASQALYGMAEAGRRIARAIRARTKRKGQP